MLVGVWRGWWSWCWLLCCKGERGVWCGAWLVEKDWWFGCWLLLLVGVEEGWWGLVWCMVGVEGLVILVMAAVVRRWG